MSDPVAIVESQERGSRWSFVLPLSAVLALMSVGIAIGTMRNEVVRLSDDMRQLRAEVTTRASQETVMLLFQDIRVRLDRNEALLDNNTVLLRRK